MSFMLDETASRITRKDVNNLKPPKILGARHNPLPHKHLIDLMEAGLVKNNFKINDLELGLTHDGNRIFGMFDVEAPSSEVMLKKHNSNYEVGFRGSYDQSLASQAVFGRGCFICSNLIISGEEKISRKNTTNNEKDIPFQIDEILKKAYNKMFLEELRVELYKSIKLSDAQAHDIVSVSLDLGRADVMDMEEIVQEIDGRPFKVWRPVVERKTVKVVSPANGSLVNKKQGAPKFKRASEMSGANVVSPQMLGKVLGDWHSPRYPEFEGERNVWGLEQCFSQFTKEINLADQFKRTRNLVWLLDRVPFEGKDGLTNTFLELDKVAPKEEFVSVGA